MSLKDIEEKYWKRSIIERLDKIIELIEKMLK